jgi:predicted ATPase/DNA-binding CsgD family transcriptional regulator
MRLPRPLTSFVGREHEVRALRDFLTRVRLLTITGPGGVGKTRVAIAVAAEHTSPDATAFVDLAPIQDPQLVPTAIALALGVRDSSETPLLDRIADVIGERRLLLVLDNCEQVVDAAPDLARLLASTPGLTILATSRVPLRIAGEQEYGLAPLPLPDTPAAETFGSALSANPQLIAGAPAVQLFVQRASAVRATFALTDANAGAIAAICARLDGLPLAIELAAAQLRTLTPAALLARLERRLPLLQGGPREAPALQRTLRDAIAWSVDLLAPDERRGFWRMAVFAGGCTLDAVAFVCAELPGDEAGLGIVSALAAHSLIEQRGSDEEPRFVMLETVREYAGELLAASGEQPMIRASHASYYVALAERAEWAMLGREQQRWFDRLSAERENHRAAIEWSLGQGDGLVAARIGAAIWRFWLTHGGIHEGLEWLRIGLAAVDARRRLADDAQLELLRAHTLIGLGQLAMAITDYGLAERCHRDAFEGYRALNHGFGIGRGLYNLGLVAEYQGDAARAEEFYRACYTHNLDQPFTYGVGLVLRGLSATALARGDLDEAYALAQKGAAVLRQANERLYLVQCLLQLGLAALALSRAAEAERHVYEAITILREIRGQFWLADALLVLGCVLAHTDPQRAARAFAAAEHLLAYQGAPLAPKTYAQIVPYVRLVRERLGPAGFAAAWRDGQRLSFEEASSLARPPASDAAPRALAPALPAPSAPAQPGGPEALSDRELEILRLLSAGLTNKEIAERLIMSVNTVHSHVKSIFAKLDVTTRAAATRAALVRGLVDPY